jgi:hypothetical protein
MMIWRNKEEKVMRSRMEGGQKMGVLYSSSRSSHSDRAD